jgi:hypothetical protein
MLMPEPFQIRAFCLCALGTSGRTCMRRPRVRRRRLRVRTGPPRGGGDDDGGGSDPLRSREPLPSDGGRL